MRFPGLVTAALLGSAGVAAAQPAAAAPAPAEEPPEIVGILAIEVTGVSRTAARKLRESIEASLAEHGLEVTPLERMTEVLERSDYMQGCRFGPCLREVKRATGVRLVLVARITSLGPSYDFVVTLLETETGRVSSQVAERCDVCTLEEAIATATLVVIQLVTGAAGATADPAIMGPTGERIGPDPLVRLARAQAEHRAGQRRLRRTALFFLGAAIVAAGAGAYFHTEDRRDASYGTLGAAGAFALASGTLLVISRF